MDNNDNLVQVDIFGQEYTVKAPANSTYITNIAEYVDSKMHEVEKNLPGQQSPTRIAILAAMNISDEFFTLRNKQAEQVDRMEARITTLIDYIDKRIEE
ncbi:MAG: cell division protein ZapA [Candidatus Marinimicrobia bacterium]|nr:cell division protein ZapA [Candidatus Neomarinimicrobiota bacterium]